MEFWIPIVIKNRDTLIGFLEAFKNFCSFYDIPSSSDVNVIISSDRFNDILPDDSRMRNYTREGLKEKILVMIKKEEERGEHEGNSEDILQDNLLNLDCSECGMFYPFTNSQMIPKENFCCENCGRQLILYTKKDADEIAFDGDEEIVEKIMDEINKDLGI